jgi:hypothetical protein
MTVSAYADSIARMPHDALIGVHEIWRWKDDRIQVFKLAAKGRYVSVARRSTRPRRLKTFCKWVTRHHSACILRSTTCRDSCDLQ